MNNFNITLSLNKILYAYKKNSFPNAYCLLWDRTELVELLADESDSVLTTEEGKGVRVDDKFRIKNN